MQTKALSYGAAWEREHMNNMSLLLPYPLINTKYTAFQLELSQKIN
jgi:hypothetical protein